jgi:hypothetical protein
VFSRSFVFPFIFPPVIMILGATVVLLLAIQSSLLHFSMALVLASSSQQTLDTMQWNLSNIAITISKQDLASIADELPSWFFVHLCSGMMRSSPSSSAASTRSLLFAFQVRQKLHLFDMIAKHIGFRVNPPTKRPCPDCELYRTPLARCCYPMSKEHRMRGYFAFERMKSLFLIDSFHCSKSLSSLFGIVSHRKLGFNHKILQQDVFCELLDCRTDALLNQCKGPCLHRCIIW